MRRSPSSAAIRLKPDSRHVPRNLGIALVDQGKLDEAIAEFREATPPQSRLAEAHVNLGASCRPGEAGRGDRRVPRGDSAQARLCRGPLQLRPSPSARGTNSPRRSRNSEGRDLAGAIPSWPIHPRSRAAEIERLHRARAELPAILAGQARPADAAESLGFAQLCYDKKLHGASARFWAEAFQSQPKLAERHAGPAPLQRRLRRGAGRMRPGQGRSAARRCRQDPLAQAGDRLAQGRPGGVVEDPGERAAPGAPSIAQTLQHWKADPDLAGLRDPAALAKLPEDEQNACRALWAEVDALLTKARDTKP